MKLRELWLSPKLNLGLCTRIRSKINAWHLISQSILWFGLIPWWITMYLIAFVHSVSNNTTVVAYRSLLAFLVILVTTTWGRSRSRVDLCSKSSRLNKGLLELLVPIDFCFSSWINKEKPCWEKVRDPSAKSGLRFEHRNHWVPLTIAWLNPCVAHLQFFHWHCKCTCHTSNKENDWNFESHPNEL